MWLTSHSHWLVPLSWQAGQGIPTIAVVSRRLESWFPGAQKPERPITDLLADREGLGQAMDSYEGTATLEWWANRSTSLGRFGVQVAVRTGGDTWMSEATLESPLAAEQ